MWAGLINTTLLGPVFIERLNGESYHKFLTDTLPELLEDIPLASLRNMYYQHDGAPAHYARQVKDYLNREYPGRWLGRGGLSFVGACKSQDQIFD